MTITLNKPSLTDRFSLENHLNNNWTSIENAINDLQENTNNLQENTNNVKFYNDGVRLGLSGNSLNKQNSFPAYVNEFILYVSNSGTGDGTTSDSPCTLEQALNKIPRNLCGTKIYIVLLSDILTSNPLVIKASNGRVMITSYEPLGDGDEIIIGGDPPPKYTITNSFVEVITIYGDVNVTFEGINFVSTANDGYSSIIISMRNCFQILTIWDCSFKINNVDTLTVATGIDCTQGSGLIMIDNSEFTQVKTVVNTTDTNVDTLFGHYATTISATKTGISNGMGTVGFLSSSTYEDMDAPTKIKTQLGLTKY